MTSRISVIRTAGSRGSRGSILHVSANLFKLSKTFVADEPDNYLAHQWLKSALLDLENFDILP